MYVTGVSVHMHKGLAKTSVSIEERQDLVEHDALDFRGWIVGVLGLHTVMEFYETKHLPMMLHLLSERLARPHLPH
jgi:hypothetical protein